MVIIVATNGLIPIFATENPLNNPKRIAIIIIANTPSIIFSVSRIVYAPIHPESIITEGIDKSIPPLTIT